MTLQGTYHPLFHCRFVSDCPLGSHVMGHAWANVCTHSDVQPKERDFISLLYSGSQTKNPLEVS